MFVISRARCARGEMMYWQPLGGVGRNETSCQPSGSQSCWKRYTKIEFKFMKTERELPSSFSCCDAVCNSDRKGELLCAGSTNLACIAAAKPQILQLNIFIFFFFLQIVHTTHTLFRITQSQILLILISNFSVKAYCRSSYLSHN